MTSWEVRNEARINSDVEPNPNRLTGKILAYVNMIQQHSLKPCHQQSCESTIAAIKWTRPSLGTVLVNSGASIFESSECMGASVIIRSHLGTCIVACRQHIVRLSSPEYTEAFALRHAVVLARDTSRKRGFCLELLSRSQFEPG